VSAVCPLNCDLCPAAGRCGKTTNFCLRGRCQAVAADPLLDMNARRSIMASLGGLDLHWPHPLSHHEPGDLPVHLPVLIQAYADVIDRPWVALHGGRLFGLGGRSLTPKHRRPLREVYRLASTTRIAIEFYVEDRVLEGLWANRASVVREIASLGVDLILSPNYSVWRDACRFEQTVQQRRAHLYYCWLREAGLPAIPDVGFSRFEPDGRLWAEWINSQRDLQAVSIFCGGKRIHAERRAHLETVEDIALLDQTVRPGVAFVLGGVHSPRRLADYRRAARAGAWWSAMVRPTPWPSAAAFSARDYSRSPAPHASAS
jgi:hypothetical protein